jgi:hypothetical protein
MYVFAGRAAVTSFILYFSFAQKNQIGNRQDGELYHLIKIVATILLL